MSQARHKPQELLEAYKSATGLAVSMSYERERVLSEAASRGLTPDDVTAVIKELKRLLANGTKGYNEASLDLRVERTCS